ncbi:MAG: hypothetical protein ACK4RV_02265 [Caulobacter sp.]
MTDTSIASLLSGDAGAPPAADPAANPPADPAPGADGNPAPADPKAVPGPNPFLDSFSDAETRAYIERKGFKDLNALGASFASLERRLFDDKQRVLLPSGDDDAEGFDRVYAALGRPETPDGYGFGELQGSDPEFAGKVAEWLHGAGVGKAKAAVLAEKWNEYVSGRATAAATEKEQQAQADWTALKADWGAQFDANAEFFRRGATTYGVDADAMLAIEDALGTKRTVELFAAIGKAQADDTFVKPDAKPKFAMTAEQAKARMDTLKKDTGWQTRWMNGGADEKAEWARLTEIAGQGA